MALLWTQKAKSFGIQEHPNGAIEPLRVLNVGVSYATQKGQNGKDSRVDTASLWIGYTALSMLYSRNHASG